MTEPPDGGSGDDRVAITVRRTHLWGVAGVVVGLAAGIAIGGALAKDDVPEVVTVGSPAALTGGGGAAPASDQTPQEVRTAGRPAVGPANAKVTVVEFTDLQCPFCRRHHLSSYKDIRADYGDRVRYVYRHFPLTNAHPLAEDLAVGAECAFRQGKFERFVDLAFRRQPEMTRSGIRELGRDAGLDSRAYAACREDRTARAAVRTDQADGTRHGVTGTPSFFVNGRLLRGAVPYAQLKAAIDAAF